MSEKKKLNSALILQLLTFAFFAGLGVFSIYYELRYFGRMTLSYYFYTIGIILVSAPLHVLFHEAGHLLAGLVSGYEFIMFRFFNHLWIYTENGLSKRKEYTPGLLGQALMVPPARTKGDKEIPVLLYHAGGLLVNGITALLFSWLGFKTGNFYVRYALYLSSLVAVFLLLSNAFPVKGTDGYNIKRYLDKEVQKDETSAILYLYRDMVKGIPFTELQQKIPIEDLQDFSLPNTSTLYSLRASAYLEQYDFENAHAINKKLWQHMDQLFEGHKADVSLNYFFTLLLTDPSHPDVEKIRQTPLYTSYRKIKLADSYRLFAAEVLYLEKNKKKALDLLRMGEKEIPYAPTVSDERLERILYDYLLQEVKSD